MTRLLTVQRQRNSDSRNDWNFYAGHRAQLTEILLEQARTKNRLAILGAGNCNDVDLQKLAEAFESIDLVDLDAEALRAAVFTQHVGPPQVRCNGDFDLSGIANLIDPTCPTSDESVVAECLQLLTTTSPRLHSTFDCVVSACLLSQLLDAVALGIHQQHTLWLNTMLAVRDHHLNLMLSGLRPGGRGVLALDFVSSQTAPDLPDVPEDRLQEYALNLIHQRNFFTAMNPLAIIELLQKDGRYASRVREARLSKPWKWNFGPRVYLVVALTFEKV